jgi:hypothetical protein
VVFEIAIKFKLLHLINSDIILHGMASNIKRENVCYFMQDNSMAYAATFSVPAFEVLGEQLITDSGVQICRSEAVQLVCVDDIKRQSLHERLHF